MTRAHLFTLFGAGVSLFLALKDSRPPVILETHSEFQILPGYSDFDCGFAGFHYAHRSTCLSGVNAEYKTVEAVENFYLAQMNASGWTKTQRSLHEDARPRANTHVFAKKETGCQMEIALSVSQNTYRGGELLEDIFVIFQNYLVTCPQPKIETWEFASADP